MLALLLLTFQAFWKARLLSQLVWTNAGLRTLALFAVIYAAFCSAILRWRPRLLAPALAIAVTLYTIAAVGPWAPLAVALFIFSSFITGQMLLKGDAVLAMLLGLSIYMLAVSVIVHAPVNYPLLYAAALAAPLACRYRTTLTYLMDVKRVLRPRPFANGSERFLACALIFILMVYWLVALEPETGADALAMHLVIPSTIRMHHSWAFNVHEHIWAIMPMGGDWCYTAVFLLGGETATRLLNLVFLILIVWLLLRACGSLLIAALFAATPVVLLVTGSLFVENLWALLAFASWVALSRYRARGQVSYLYVAGILLGAAAATKLGALAFVPPLGLILLWVLRKTGRSSVRHACGAATLFLLFAAPTYLTAYVKTRNPVFPFGGPASPADQRFDRSLSLHTLSDLTFHTSGYVEGQDGAAGFQYFLFVPLSILLFRRRSSFAVVTSALVFVLFTILTMRVQANLRYLYAGLPFAMLFIGSSFADLKQFDRRLYRIAVALSIVVLGFDIYFLPSSGWEHKDLVINSASARARSQYIAQHAPVRMLVEYLNENHPGAPVAFFDTNAIAGLRAPAFTNMWHTPDFSGPLAAAQSPSDCLGLMRKFGVKFLVVPASGPAAPPALREFLQNSTAEEYRCGAFRLLRIVDNPLADLKPQGCKSSG